MCARLKTPTPLPRADDLRAVLAFNLRRLRVKKSLSQEDLALECGLDRTYVSAVERCRWNVSLSNLKKFADALGCEAWQLLTLSDDLPKK